MKIRRNSSSLGSKCAVVVVALIVAGGITGLARGQCKRWVQMGPDGGGVYSLAVDPQTSSTLYAGAGGALYRSTDRGANWMAVEFFDNSPVVALAIHSATPSTVYAAAAPDGLHRSTDRGNHWTEVGGIIALYRVQSLAYDPSTSSILYAGTIENGVFKSTDGGYHWQGSGLVNQEVHSLAIDASTPSTLYAGTETGVYRSTDGGGSWTASSGGLPDLWIKTLAIDPVTPSTLFAGTENSGVFRSTDQGANWTPVNNGLTGTRIEALLFDRSTPAALYAGTAHDVFRTTDGGTKWTPLKSGQRDSHVTSLAIDHATPSTVYAGTWGGGVIRSTDTGGHWTAINTGLNGQTVRALAIDPTSPSTVLLGTQNSRLFRSVDRGVNWTNIDTGLSDSIFVFVVDGSDAVVVYAGTNGGVRKSTDRGASWTAANTGIPDWGVSALAMDPVTSSTLYAGTLQGRVYRSTDRGASWTSISNGLTDGEVHSVVIDPLTTSTLYVGTESGIYRSIDQGANWTPVNGGLTEMDVKCLAIDPMTPSTLYAGTRNGAFRSTDQGANWTPASNGLVTGSPIVNALVFDPLTPPTLYAGTGYGVFRTTDQGANWTPLNEGLANSYVFALAIDPQNPSILYAGTYGSSMFRMELDCALRFSQFGKGVGFSSDLVLNNLSPSQTVSASIASADDNGLPLMLLENVSPTQLSIPPQGMLTLSTGTTGPLVVGSATITAKGGLGGLVRFTIPGIGTAGVAASEPTSRLIAPVRRSADGVNAGVALANLEPHPVTLDLTLLDPQGHEVSGGRRTIADFAAHGHMARFIDELFPEANTDNFEGTLVVKTERGQIVAAALELGTQAGEFTALPVTPLTTLGTHSELSFAQFGNGQGLTSDTVLVNPRADASVSGTLTFLNDEGQPLQVGLIGSGQQSSVPFSIPPLAEVTISTDGIGSLAVGSARATADGPVAGVVRYRIQGIGTAGVGHSQQLSKFVIPVRQTAAGIRFAIAIQNNADAPVTITLTLRSADGASVPGGTATLNALPAHGHRARFLEELFPETQAHDFQGTVWVEVTPGGAVAATALEIGSKPGEFTTLPVTPVE